MPRLTAVARSGVDKIAGKRGNPFPGDCWQNYATFLLKKRPLCQAGNAQSGCGKYLGTVLVSEGWICFYA
jgi:hypothetical protein